MGLAKSDTSEQIVLYDIEVVWVAALTSRSQMGAGGLAVPDCPETGGIWEALPEHYLLAWLLAQMNGNRRPLHKYTSSDCFLQRLNRIRFCQTS